MIDIFAIWTHGEQFLKDFIEKLNLVNCISNIFRYNSLHKGGQPDWDRPIRQTCGQASIPLHGQLPSSTLQGFSSV